MKKRKPPIVLATVLIIMLVAVGIMYAPRPAGDAQEHAQQAPPPPSAEQGERAKVNSSQVSAMAMASMNPQGEAGGPQPAPKSGKPSIAMPKQSTYKPTPNDSSTSTQWYTDKTRK